MALDFEDLVLRPCLDVFGQKARYYDHSGNWFEVSVIFDEPSEAIDAVNGINNGDSGVIASRTMAGIRLKDFPNDPQMGDQLVCKDITYSVREILKDGQGGAHLVLTLGTL